MSKCADIFSKRSFASVATWSKPKEGDIEMWRVNHCTLQTVGSTCVKLMAEKSDKKKEEIH